MKSNERATIRKRAGLTQYRLARRTGIHASTISLWENHELELAPEAVETWQARSVGNYLYHWVIALSARGMGLSWPRGRDLWSSPVPVHLNRQLSRRTPLAIGVNREVSLGLRVDFCFSPS